MTEPLDSGREVEVRDWNGTGRWSADAVLERYRSYSKQLGTFPDDKFVPITRTEGEVTWVYPIMDWVIAGIERGDKACIAIGIEFVEEDQRFPFGRILKSNTARALRRAELSQ